MSDDNVDWGEDDDDDGAVDWGDDGDNDAGGDGDGGWGGTALVEAGEEENTEMTPPAAKAEAPGKAHLVVNYKFAPQAFGKIQQQAIPKVTGQDLSGKISSIFSISVKGVKAMKSQTRDGRPVLHILQSVYRGGLSKFGSSDPVNQQVIPALRFSIAAMAQLKTKDPTRVAVLGRLARAAEDCQQVQAREILRVYGDLTCQTQTLESQVHYFLLKQKEDALDRFITRYHLDCDKSHTQLKGKPWKQRAHLKSAYMVLLGEKYGLEGVDAAQRDELVTQAKEEVQNGTWADQGITLVLALLKKSLDLPMFVSYLLADINNQSKTAERCINRDVIFAWAKKHMSTEDAHLVFYDEERASHYADQDPDHPKEANKFQPFLSTRLLLKILVQMAFIERK